MFTFSPNPETESVMICQRARMRAIASCARALRAEGLVVDRSASLIAAAAIVADGVAVPEAVAMVSA